MSNLDFSDEELLRYSRQIMLPGFDVAGQLALRAAKVLIIGAGGLGSPAAMYLAAAGIGEINLIDDDVVELSNLQRQIMHRESSLSKPKVESAQESLRSLNSSCQVNVFNERFSLERWASRLGSYTVVLDCSDNFETRFAVNEGCLKAKVPLVSAAAIRMEGQLVIFDSRNSDSPCYECLYARDGEDAQTCSESGVMAPLVGILGSLQAMEAIKLCADYGEPSAGRLIIYDALSLSWRSLKLTKDNDCKACGDLAS